MARCLVVSESATLRRILTNQIQALGGEVLQVVDGKQALDRCDESVRLVVTDWNLPLLSGIDLTQQLRANAATAKVAILMVSARSARVDVRAAIDAGVDDYLLKPFSAEVLKSKLEPLMIEAEETGDAQAA